MVKAKPLQTSLLTGKGSFDWLIQEINAEIQADTAKLEEMETLAADSLAVDYISQTTQPPPPSPIDDLRINWDSQEPIQILSNSISSPKMVDQVAVLGLVDKIYQIINSDSNKKPVEDELTRIDDLVTDFLKNPENQEIQQKIQKDVVIAKINDLVASFCDLDNYSFLGKYLTPTVDDDYPRSVAIIN